MKLITIFLAALAALMAPALASAAISCSVASSGFAAAYDPASPAVNSNQASFTVTCTKGLVGDPASVNISVVVDNGSHSLGINNRARMGLNTLRYDTYRDGGCSVKWKGATAISGVVSTPTVGIHTATFSYWGCILPGLTPAAGTYTDTVLMTMTYGPGAGVVTSSSFGVTITTPATCSLTAPPANLIFNYLAYGPAVNPVSTFGITCTLGLSYSMALDATVGTAVGLNYTLGLSAPSGVGNGAQQMHSVNGGMIAGQGGTCGGGVCSATQARTLTLSY